MQRNVLIALLVFLGLLCCLGPALAQGPPMYREMFYYNGLSTDPGWTTTGGWQYGTYDGDCCVNEAHSAGGMYGHLLGSHYGPDIVGDTLTTTALDCTGKYGVNVTVAMAWGLGAGDYVAIEASRDGEAWTPVWEVGSQTCNGWHPVTCDISAVADNWPTVYLRWVFTSDSNTTNTCHDWGVDVGDLMLSAETTTRPLRVAIVAPYSEDLQASGGITSIACQNIPHVWLNWMGDDCETLCGLVSDGVVDVIVISTPEWMQESGPSAPLPVTGVAENPCMVRCGEQDAGPGFLWDFVRNGGTVVSCGEAFGESGFMRGTGLLDLQWAGSYMAGYPLTPVAESPLLAGTSSPFTSTFLTNSYLSVPTLQPALADAAGNSVVACRDYGAGAAIALGYSYNDYDENGAQALINAVNYGRASRNVLVYDTSNTHTAAAALDQLGLPYTTAGAADFDSQLASKQWDMVLVDNPATADQDWTGLLGYVENGGKVALSSTGLELQPLLREEFGVSEAEVADLAAPVHWTAEGSYFLSSIPELLSWNDTWATSGYRLWAGATSDLVLAQYDAIPESQCQDALVVANHGRTVLNGFLWDERNQDNDSDGVDDTVELVMVEIQHLFRVPKADFVGVPKAGGVPLEVAFTDLSTNFPIEWSWDFGDGSTSSEQNPVHVYAEPGLYSVTLTVWSDDGQDSITKTNYVELATAAPAADFSATPTSGIVPLTVSFSDLSTNTPTAWLWNFGDGSTSDVQNPSHEYTAPGTYTVTLTASNGLGTDTEEKAAYIAVNPPAVVAAFSANVTSGFAPLVVEFSNESSGDLACTCWDFGDGTWSANRNPIHVYSKAGYYTVSLWIADDYSEDTVERANYIVVSFIDAPSDNWAYDAIMACVQNDIVQGYGYEYRPDGVVKRDQIAVFFARALAGGEEHVPTAPAVATFPDVPTTHWAFKHVEYLKSYDVVHGYHDGYHPDEQVNRAQTAVFAARAKAGGEAALSSYTPPTTSPFSDVAPDFWAYTHITYCQAQDIVKGYSDGTYVPDRLVTRDQMAVYIARTFGLLP